MTRFGLLVGCVAGAVVLATGGAAVAQREVPFNGEDRFPAPPGVLTRDYGPNPPPPGPVITEPAPATVFPEHLPTTDPVNRPNIPLDVPVWAQVPRVRMTPPLGNFFTQPTGRGYYSIADQLRGTRLVNPPKYGYPRFGLMSGSFFDADFRYLDDPNNIDCDYADPIKRIHLTEDWLLSLGGEERMRYEHNYNAQLTRVNDLQFQNRVRLYSDLWYKDSFRFYAELISGYQYWEDLPPGPFDENKLDFLNLFIDLKLAECGGCPAYVRVGRQELLFGSQRLVSPNDWANSRRTFQGVRGFRQTEWFDFDVFWTQPVAVNPGQFDSVDNNQNFAGAWGTVRPAKGHVLDFYYLLLDNVNRVNELGIQRSPFTVNTIGTRYAARNPGGLLWDFEGALQYGKQDGQTIQAGMATVGAGYQIERRFWNPTFWVYYDYASGDNKPTDNKSNTFFQLFPYDRYYLGFTDLVGRKNIHDLNCHLFLYPTNWLTFWFQYHHFWLASDKDALYNARGVAIRRDPTGRSGNDVGQEIDFIFNFHINKHTDLMAGYSYLYGSQFLELTRRPGTDSNSGMTFVQLNYRW